jgi:hypothetical protein
MQELYLCIPPFRPSFSKFDDPKYLHSFIPFPPSCFIGEIYYGILSIVSAPTGHQLRVMAKWVTKVAAHRKHNDRQITGKIYGRKALNTSHLHR